MAKSLESAELRPAKVLVVDDDERNLLALSEVLNPIASVVTASSGRDALRRLMTEDFAVILLDVFMPGIDGYETASLIREREQTARIPIIFLSAVNKETEHLMRGYAMGAVDYVFKPVDPMILKSKVCVFVDLYLMRRQVEEQAEAEQQLREAHYREQLNRIEVERQLEDAQRRQASILQSLPMVIYEAEDQGDGQIRRQIVGGDLVHFVADKAPDLIEGRASWDDWVHPEDKQQLVARHDEGESFAAEYRWIGPDGSTRYLLDQRISLPPRDGQARWAGTLLDITERKSLEAQLTHIGKLEALGQLTGGVAHDFNNLLAALLGGIHVLQRRLEIGEREQRVIDQMRHATEQGADLVRRMMAFARQQDLTPASVDPANLCESVAGLVNHTLGGTVKVNWQAKATKLNLYVDRNQLELALMNLIINARDAMPDGGEIMIAIEETADAANRPFLRISVIDSGVGIPEDQIAKVTEPFYTTKETGKGTGLGLSMVAGFVIQSGGEIQIDSKVGEGTTVHLMLPATEAEAVQAAPQGGSDAPWLKGKRLMLVDDEDSVRIVLSEQFRDAGATVDEFSCGKAAIAAAKNGGEAYDYVLSDFAMPGIDGLQTLRAIEQVAPKARLALMTGYADDARLADNATMPVLRKPIDIDKVSQVFAGDAPKPKKAASAG